MSRLLVRLLSGVRDRVSDPWYYGTQFEGRYWPKGNRVTGVAVPGRGEKKRPPKLVTVVHRGETIASTEAFEQHGEGWYFAIEFDKPPAERDFLDGTLKVFAINETSGHSELPIDGAAQLDYIRSAYAQIMETEFTLDFTEGGNSKQFLLDGWYGQEPTHVWTEGKQSTIALNFGVSGARYRLEMLAWTFVVPETLPTQTLSVSIAGSPLGVFNLAAGQHQIGFDVPSDVTKAGQVILQLDHPNAARACDVSSALGTRTIAFAVRRLELKRYSDGAGAPQPASARLAQ